MIAERLEQPAKSAQQPPSPGDHRMTPNPGETSAEPGVRTLAGTQHTSSATNPAKKGCFPAGMFFWISVFATAMRKKG